MGGKVNLKDVPTAAWVVVGVAFVAVVAAAVVLDVTGSDAAQFRGLFNMIANLASILLGSGGLVYAGVAARNAKQAAEQTNGLLAAERQQIAAEAATAAVRVYRETGNVPPGGQSDAAA